MLVQAIQASKCIWSHYTRDLEATVSKIIKKRREEQRKAYRQNRV